MCPRPEEQPDRRAVAELGVELDRAPVPAHDPERRGEPEASSRELGGEEGVEEPLARELVPPAAGVCDLEVDVGPGRERLLEVGRLEILRLSDL